MLAFSFSFSFFSGQQQAMTFHAVMYSEFQHPQRGHQHILALRRTEICGNNRNVGGFGKEKAPDLSRHHHLDVHQLIVPAPQQPLPGQRYVPLHTSDSVM